MPSELRHIMFRPPEVVHAVTEYHRRIGQPLPPGSVICGTPESGGPGDVVRFRIALTPDHAGTGKAQNSGEPARREVVVEGPALAAALILFCRNEHIPLPARAEKSLQIFGDQVVLVCAIGARNGEMPQSLPIRP
jgi:hypothetical protein